MTRLAGIELGGTKSIAVLAEGGSILEQRSFPTATPDATLAQLNATLRDWDEAGKLAALGIASFGPVRLDPESHDYARMLDTPKRGWRGARVGELIAAGLNCPWTIDTDVNAAALAEYARGSAIGCDSLCYVTIGTGVGGGLVIGGRPVHGALHPEIGHLRLRRAPGDFFAGACPFHSDCIEGLVSGPALAARFGTPGDAVANDHPDWAYVAADLGELAASILLTTSAERIVFGGSVALGRPFLLPLIQKHIVATLGSYLPYVSSGTAHDLIVLSQLVGQAGPLGAIALADQALRLAEPLRAQ
jgi:fructokinase